CGDLGKLVAGRLRGAVGAELRSGREDILGSVDDDVAAQSLRDHDPRRLANRQKVTDGVDLLDTAKGLAGGVQEWTGVRDAGVGDADVEAANALADRPERPPNRGFVRYVDLEGKQPVFPGT